MKQANVIKGSPLYIKKKVAIVKKDDDDDQLSIANSELVGEDKHIQMLDGDCSFNMYKPLKQPEATQAAVEQALYSYGSSRHFRHMIHRLLAKRKTIKKELFKSEYKPEIYDKGFRYYYEIHKYTVMLRKGARKVNCYPKSCKNNTRCMINFNTTNNKINFDTSVDQKSFVANNTSMQRSVTSRKLLGPSNNRYLTQIPNKIEDENNKRLDMAYNKAKDAARVVRRLEYSYNMKINCLYNKPIHKLNAKRIQKWWRQRQLDRFRRPFVIRMQKVFRGKYTRLAFRQTYYFVKSFPVLSKLNEYLVGNVRRHVMDELFFRYGLKALNIIVTPYVDFLIKRIKHFLLNRLPPLPKIYMIKSAFFKHIMDRRTMRKLNRAQGAVKIFLMHNNEKIILWHARKIHPNLYFFLKYGSKLYNKKIVQFRRCYLRLKEYNLQVNKGLENRFELLPYLLRKKYWALLKSYNTESMRRDKTLPAKKRFFRKSFIKNDKNNLLSALEHWKLYIKLHKRFISPHNNATVKVMVKTLQAVKDIYSTIFINKLRSKAHGRPTRKEALRKLLLAKLAKTPADKTIINKFYQQWRMLTQQIKMKKSLRKMNKFLNETRAKYRQSKAIKHFFMLNLIKAADFYKKSSSITQVIKKNIARHVLMKIRSIGFKQRMEALFIKFKQPVKTKFLQWAFENRKYKHAIKDYVVFLKYRNTMQKRSSRLTLIYKKTLHRMKYRFLRQAFICYRKNSNVYYKNTYRGNIQMNFIDKSIRPLNKTHYRFLHYTIAKFSFRAMGERADYSRFITDVIIKDNTALANANGKTFKQYFLTNRCKKISLVNTILKKKKLLLWRKINQKLRLKSKIAPLQKNFRKYAHAKINGVYPHA